MSKETKLFLGIIVGLIVVVVGLILVNKKTPGKYDDFAMCISDSGTKFFGAYWCPHCASQKALFGKSAKKLPYVECAVSESTQTQECIDAGVQSYPTWEFPDGARQTGELSFVQLAEKTGCPVPTQ